jgi:maleate cis-trans isomerase
LQSAPERIAENQRFKLRPYSPYSDEVNKRAGRYFAAKHGLQAVALEGFGATDSYAIGQLGPENARNAFARIDRPAIEVFVVPGGNFPTMTSIAQWEREFGKPVVTTNQARSGQCSGFLARATASPALAACSRKRRPARASSGRTRPERRRPRSR